MFGENSWTQSHAMAYTHSFSEACAVAQMLQKQDWQEAKSWSLRTQVYYAGNPRRASTLKIRAPSSRVTLLL